MTKKKLKKNDKYPLEEAFKRVGKELIRLNVVLLNFIAKELKIFRLFIVRKKTKMEKLINLFEIGGLLMFTLGIFLQRVTGK